MSTENNASPDITKECELAQRTAELLGELRVITTTERNQLIEGIVKGQLPGSSTETILGLINTTLNRKLEEGKRDKRIITEK